MNFRKPRPEDPEINLIPFIDVLLVVLIFLMLSTTYSKFTELSVTLPSANADASRDRPAEIIVAVASDGRYTVTTRPSSAATSTRSPPRCARPRVAQGAVPDHLRGRDGHAPGRHQRDGRRAPRGPVAHDLRRADRHGRRRALSHTCPPRARRAGRRRATTHACPFARLLQRHWWRPRLTALTAALVPLAGGRRVATRRRAKADAEPLPVPVIVVGNVIVGGAGKTPTVIALAALLRTWGCTPGIVSRGHGRADAAALLLDASTPAAAATPAAFGDEPLLMHRRTGAPVAVARERREAALRLLAAHPEVDVLIADDGLQHHALPARRRARGVRRPRHGQRLAAAGRPAARACERDLADQRRHPTPFHPRQRHLPAAPARALPAPRERCFEATRSLGGALALADWARGAPATLQTLHALRGRPVLAAAGIGDPERFFAMLEAEGLTIARLPLADHAAFEALPWPAGTADVVITEKDAVKLAGRPLGATRAWVVTLDFGLPPPLAHALRDALQACRPPA